jgi:hypothetical protein|eukprot:SAG25_NODE_286_length_10355_cov_16.654544_12_plen_60_part_00
MGGGVAGLTGVACGAAAAIVLCMQGAVFGEGSLGGALGAYGCAAYPSPAHRVLADLQSR